MTVLSNLKVFATHPHDCSYLPGEQATTLFIDPAAEVDAHLYSQLSELGFRRSGPHLYRPHCAGCDACIPARIPVDQFAPNRQQRRIWKRNQDLRVEIREQLLDDEEGPSCPNCAQGCGEVAHSVGSVSGFIQNGE